MLRKSKIPACWVFHFIYHIKSNMKSYIISVYKRATHMTWSKIRKHKFNLIVVYNYCLPLSFSLCVYCVFVRCLVKPTSFHAMATAATVTANDFRRNTTHNREERKTKMPKSIVLVMWKHGIYTIRTYKFVFVCLSML